MANNLILTPARLKRMASALRNLPLFVLASTVSLAVEVFAWGGILTENQATVTIAGATVRLAYAEVAMSSAFSLAALVLAAAAASMKADPRIQQRKRAGASQTLAVLVLLAPINYAAHCSAMAAQNAERNAYIGTPQYEADLHDANDRSGNVDSMARREAADRLGQANPVTYADFVHLAPAFVWISLILFCNMAAVRLGWRAKPETPAEARARIASQRAHKARLTRERNRQQDETNITPIRSRA